MVIFHRYVNVYQRVTPPLIHHPPWSSRTPETTLAIRLTFALGLHGPRKMWRRVTTGQVEQQRTHNWMDMFIIVYSKRKWYFSVTVLIISDFLTKLWRIISIICKSGMKPSNLWGVLSYFDPWTSPLCMLESTSSCSKELYIVCYSGIHLSILAMIINDIL